ncbi:MAG: hypothetical protein K2N15_04805 [Lachnospiraceae bacterium]|nr:hypothetical protein [Lachnospiraceae bacterium]
MNKEELKKALKELYVLYHFRLEREVENILVFSYCVGYFHNAEIVLLEDNDSCRKLAREIEKEYKEIEYNRVVTGFYESIQATHDKLFKAFFSLKDSQKRLRLEYQGFCKKKTEKLLDEYVYIPCHYRDSRGEECEDLVNIVVKSAEKREARLIILEAAAGYGKTCTAYEILNAFLDCQEEKIPLFIELSKNRTARIFRHVLYDEIDRKFTQLSSETVIQEIKNGRLPLIIDGFDELIEQKAEKQAQDTEEEINEHSLTLLSTIAELLGNDSEAWVLLTTRRSAIFTGDIFEEWILSHLGDECNVDRMQIQMPSLKEWINPKKYALIKEGNLDMEKLSNPVLLTFIRNAKMQEFEEMIQSSDMILNKYFGLLLTRELERQNLEFTEDELHTVMKQLAAEFVRYDMKSETIEFIQDLLQEILKEDLLRYRVRYKDKYLTEEGILSTDEYVRRVSHNYLLDRISANSNQISFINEFIFGILIGEAVRDDILKGEELYERFIDMSATAFAVRGEEIRKEYYAKIKPHLEQVSNICRLNAEMCLLHEVDSDYTNGYFRGFYFKSDFNFRMSHKFLDCTFDTCTFDGCKIQAEVFVDCKFVNCQFYDINVEGVPNQNLIFMSCEGYEKLINSQVFIENDEDVDYYEKLVLEQFWKRGYDRAELRRTYTALFRGTKSNEQVHVQNAINSLLKRGLLNELNVCYELNTQYIEEICHILGRR